MSSGCFVGVSEMVVPVPTVESMAVEIALMDRSQLIEALLSFRGAFQLDFTVEFLAEQSIDQLRHILLAARLQGA